MFVRLLKKPQIQFHILNFMAGHLDLLNEVCVEQIRHTRMVDQRHQRIERPGAHGPQAQLETVCEEHPNDANRLGRRHRGHAGGHQGRHALRRAAQRGVGGMARSAVVHVLAQPLVHVRILLAQQGKSYRQHHVVEIAAAADGSGGGSAAAAEAGQGGAFRGVVGGAGGAKEEGAGRAGGGVGAQRAAYYAHSGG
jgi:hypothetical protein